MTVASEVVCIGDLFVEYLVSEVRPGTTRVVDAARSDLGGTAFNICWYLDRLGVRSRLVAPFSRHERARLVAAAPRVSASEVLWGSESPDILIVVTGDAGHQAVYLRADLPPGVGERVEKECRSARQVVLAGSRHAPIRRMFVRLARRGGFQRLIFSPSYTVYEFTREELKALLDRVDLVVLNESEADFVCSKVGCRTLESLRSRVAGSVIVTLAERGAELHGPTGRLTARSISRVGGDVVGAGDAFLAGYLYGTTRGLSLEGSLYFASGVAAQVARSGNVRTAVKVGTTRRLVADSWTRDREKS